MNRRTAEEEDENLIYSNGQQNTVRSTSALPKYICGACCLLFLVLLSLVAFFGAKYRSAEILREYVDKQSLPPFTEQEFAERVATIEDGGEKVCKLPIRESYVPVKTKAAMLAMAGNNEIRNIVNIGTRIATTSRKCDPAKARSGQYPQECAGSRWFSHSSLADYVTDVYTVSEGKVFRPDVVIAVVTNPFDTAFRLYRAKKICEGSLYDALCDINKKIDISETELRSKEYAEFTEGVFGRWFDFMAQVEALRTTMNVTTVYLDDFTNTKSGIRVAREIYTLLYDELLSPDVEDSVLCLEYAMTEAKVFPVEFFDSYSSIYSNATMSKLCSTVKDYWNFARWKKECK